MISTETLKVLEGKSFDLDRVDRLCYRMRYFIERAAIGTKVSGGLPVTPGVSCLR